MSRKTSYSCCLKENIFLFALCAGISEIFCGVVLGVEPIRYNPTQACLPLSRRRQMTSIPAAAAHRQNTRGQMGKGSSTLSTATTRDTRLPFPPIKYTNGHWHMHACPQVVVEVNSQARSPPQTLRILASLRAPKVDFTPQPHSPESFTCVPRPTTRALWAMKQKQL